VIDASGDADYCHWAGYEYEKAGDLEPSQSMTTTFRMSNVELDEFNAAGGRNMLLEKMKEAYHSGNYRLPRKKGSTHEMCQPKCISTVAVKVSSHDALDPESMTNAEIEGRRQAFVYEEFFRNEVPGYKHAKIIGLSSQIGVRETRRVYGEYRLTKEDCMSAKQFKDQILLCGAPIEDHRNTDEGGSETIWQHIPKGGAYGVPYGTIVHKGSQHAWVAGRCFSATHDAHASCRSMAQTMAMGQAAGFAASIALEEDCNPQNIDINKLQHRLLEYGGVLESPEKEADISFDGWQNN